MNMLKCILLLVALNTLLLGQIVIDWTEIPHDIGIEFTHNGVESVTVNVGSPGGPCSWAFTTQPSGVQNASTAIVPRESTPYGDSFPTANLVLQITEDGSVAYAYSQITPSFICELGVCSLSPAMLYRFDPADTVPLAIVYGALRHYYSSSSVPFAPNIVIRTDDYGLETNDAYGSVTVNYGTFECLRSQSYDTIVTTTLVYGIPVVVDTTTNIIYNFLAEDYGLIAHVLSYADEANPYFTNALFLERLTDFSTGVLDGKDEPVAQYYLDMSPNPASGMVEIRCTIHDAGYTENEIRISKCGEIR
jgi:hypothetical protein